MAYLAPIHRPSGARHALKLTFLTPEEESLVVAYACFETLCTTTNILNRKCNRLEFYQITAEGLILKHTKTIYGAVTILEKLRPKGSSLDQLFVGTDRYTYFTLSWHAEKKQLRTEKSYVDMSSRVERGSQSVERCMVNPTKQFLTLEVFEGILTVIPLFARAKGKNEAAWALGDPISSRIEERIIRSWTYLHQPEARPNSKAAQPKVAILYEDNAQKCRLSLKRMAFAHGGSGEPDTADFIPDETDGNFDMDMSSSHLIPVEAPSYGFLVLAETCLTYWNDATLEKELEPLEEATIWAAWTQVDSCRWLLADDYGRLYFLMLVLGGEREADVVGLRLDKLGDVTRPSTLIYLDGGYVFVGSNYGNCQVVKVREGGLEVIQSLSVIAPITDFTIMDMGSRSGDGQVNEYSSGQARIVTGSGAFQDGSLRSVRSGVGLEDLGSLGRLEHITNLFSLKSTYNQQYCDVLVASFISESRVFTFDEEGDVEEVESFKGFRLEEGTLLAQNLPQNRLLQCVGSGVRLIDAENGMVVAEYLSQEKPIVAASTDSRYLALSLDGAEAVILDLDSELQEVARKVFGVGQQISCLHVPDLIKGICIVGSWHTADVALLKIDTLEALQTVSISEDDAAVPRFILLTQLLPDHMPTLLVALADGNVITFDMHPSSLALTNRKSTILGTQQANLRALPKEGGLFQVFATCEHPSVIYGSEGRIVFSAVTADKASCICSFDSQAYPGAIAIASPDNLSIALVDSERTTHVQTLHVGEVVRRIAYSTKLKAFGLGTIKRTLKDGAEIVQSSFKLADEVVFTELDSYSLREEEIIESVMRADIDENGRVVERFVVGTAYIKADEPDAVRGRILIFEVTQDRLLNLVDEQVVSGACRALATIRGRIVAALMKRVSNLVFVIAYQADQVTGCHILVRIRRLHETHKLPYFDNANRSCSLGRFHRGS